MEKLRLAVYLLRIGLATIGLVFNSIFGIFGVMVMVAVTESKLQDVEKRLEAKR